MFPSMQQGRLLRSLARPCRFVAHRRYPAAVCSRRFHLSTRWLSSAPSDGAPGSTPGNVANDIPAFSAEPNVPSPSGASPITAPSVERPEKNDSKPYGSAIRRSLRNKKAAAEQAAPKVTVPKWFRERNTVLHDGEGRTAADTTSHVKIGAPEVEAGHSTTGREAQGGEGGEEPSVSGEPSSGGEHRYVVAEALWEELCASARAGIRLPPAKYAKEPAARKAHLVLQYPGNDGVMFLDAVVKKLSQELGADLVTLNAQDIAELCSQQDLADTGATTAIRSLGYEVYRPSVSESFPEAGDEAEADDDALDTPMPSRNFRPTVKGPKFITIDGSRDTGDIPLPNLFGLKSLVASFNGNEGSAGSASQYPTDRSEDRRLQLLHELISSPGQQRTPATKEQEAQPSEATESANSKPNKTRDVIVQVQDYGEIQNTREGGRFIYLLQKAIQDRRGDGSRVLFVGTAAQEATPESDASRLMQNAFDDQFSQMLVVTPAMRSEAVEKALTEDRTKRTLDINIRHMQDMLRSRLHDSPSALKDDIFAGRDWPLDIAALKDSGLDERYWSYSQIHWATTLALGGLKTDEPFGFEHIQRGIEMMQRTDRVKNNWLQDKATKSAGTPENDNDREKLLSSLRKTCNSHEKKLLNGVVDAKSIRTTFSDVQVPPETIDALKTLTSLSLIRPEAFTYGVLATDKIPGLLLYGPPGTGKTLLAKAVARESGATVLEVSGSEVYDMYVGEGEKNVKAIFTLAKKLSPCVVFIDEADAIFCSRTGASSRTSHRELINQFLREWDGMNDLSAFIMVATNRPFDLDDAVLRRLPRRLLVDLPKEQDRLAILKIHLKDETLDSTVDLAELARRTDLYSGSDLKNLSVAAALACVREENDLAAQHQGDEPYQYPERRTLTRTHFERGMEEISASISEDMSSLSAIRKFDEQYGDRKGRRKKSPGWGFMPASVEEKGTDAARVRT